MSARRRQSLVGALALMAALAACQRPATESGARGDHGAHDHGAPADPPAQDHGSHGAGGHDEHAGGEPEMPRGPHGGRMVAEGDFALELVILERGVPPELRVYPSRGGNPIPATDVRVSVELRRFGGRVDRLAFTPREDHLVGDHTVEEPHSFDVRIDAVHDGVEGHWEYPAYDGRTVMAPGAIAASGIEIATAGPATIRTTVRAAGRIVPNGDRLVHAVPRYPGIVKDVRKRLGDRVQAGEILAVVESNQSLQPYELRAPLAGTIIAKHASPGELVGDGEPVYVVADLGTVWVDVQVLPVDFRKLRLGQRAIVDGGEGLGGEGRLVHLSPFGSEVTQTVLARIELENATGDWHPGLFARVEVVTEETEVPIAVRPSALQTFRDWDVVFLNEDATFQAMPVEVGRRDRDAVEIVAGLAGGERYAAGNSFIVKADIAKAGATHDH